METAPSRFQFDPSTVTANLEVQPKGEYELLIGDPKVFSKTAGEDNHPSFGILFQVTIQEPGFAKGKKQLYNIYFQNPAAFGMIKQFQMAVLGFKKTKEDEDRFNQEYGSLDWNIDFAAKTCGDGWKELSGKRAICALDQGKNPRTGDANQQFGSWRPISSGPIQHDNG